MSALLMVAACLWAGHGVAGKLVTGGWAPPGASSVKADALLSERFHGGVPDLLLLTRTAGSVDAPEARETGRRLVERLCADRKVSGVTAYWTGPVVGLRARGFVPQRLPDVRDPMLRSGDGHDALIAVRLNGDARHAAVDRLVPAVTGRHGPLQVTASGAALVVKELQQQSQRDLHVSELIAVPTMLVLLVWAFGGIGAACLPLAVGGVAIVGTLAVLRAVSEITEVSVYALNVTSAVGLALAVDYSLFLVARYREERATGLAHVEAIERAMESAGRTVVVASGAVVLSLAGLLVFPLSFLRSLAYAGIPVVVLSAVASLVLVPAGLSCFGGRFAGHTRRGLRRIGGTGEGWRRLTVAVMRHRTVAAVGAALVLTALALPFRQASFALGDERVLPGTAPVIQAMSQLRTAFPQSDHTEVDVILPRWVPAANAAGPARLDAYARHLSTLPGAASVRTSTGVYTDGERLQGQSPPIDRRYLSPAGTWLAVYGPTEPFGPASVRLASAVRHARAPTRPLVAGPPARLLDVRHAVAARLPWAIGVVVAATLLVLLLFTGSLFLAVKALVMNALSMTATFGAMVWIFQDGHLRSVLGDFTVTGGTDLFTPIMVFCLAFGLSLDYEVLLLARVMEAHRRTGETTTAVAAGLRAAAPLFTTSALVVGAVLLSLAASDITTIKVMGVTIALSVAVDALIVRPVLAPAVMALAGEANWWSPMARRGGTPAPGRPRTSAEPVVAQGAVITAPGGNLPKQSSCAPRQDDCMDADVDR
ncbi:MMPL family transporter [Streptomyces sp. RPT161]|uniref:MMPL family transporter n=1 Tax=Streptomyces sp. RPT161 TaxID=3015993 RepID=UPI0022B8CA15|nr:MMPL family transporter [Streptomyces sp. RPT161]